MVNVFKKINLKELVISVIFALATTVVCVLVYALIVKLLCLNSTAVLVGNTVIKIISIFIGVFLGIKERENGAIKGALIGGNYIFFSYLLFSLLSGEKLFSGLGAFSMVFGVIVGLISGIIAVNLHK